MNTVCLSYLPSPWLDQCSDTRLPGEVITHVAESAELLAEELALVPQAAGVSVPGVVRRDEDPGATVLDHLGDPADRGGDHRPAQRHRLEDREALRFAV